METKKMFTAKKQSLIETKGKTSVTKRKVNPFIEFGMKKHSETFAYFCDVFDE